MSARLAPLDPGIGVGEVHLSAPDRLDLGSGQGDPRLERLVDRELVAGAAVDGDRLLRHGRILPYPGRNGKSAGATPMLAACTTFLYGVRERKEVMCSDRQYA